MAPPKQSKRNHPISTFPCLYQMGILDAGFVNVDINPAFETMRSEGRLLGSHDFVDGDTNVFESSEHGANVLSIMAADIPGTYVGSAPKASYWLLRTEFANTETLIEEYNWAAGAEFADSVGVDVINSSLGYSTFDYADMNHTYADMNGNQTVITKAADIAASKGMLVVTSAGNLGGQDWHYISAPADADSVLTVGAVDSSGVIGYFSSNGPTADGRVKPNVVGQGVMTAYVNVNGNTSAGNGTSYSSPLMAGLTTCLWQANRNKNNMSIIKEIEQSASLFDAPNGEYGYGEPNFYNSMLALGVYPSNQNINNTRSFLYPNPFNTELNVYYYASGAGLVKLEFMDVSGRVLSSQQQEVYSNIPYRFMFNEWQNLSRGVYFVRISNNSGQQMLKAMKVD
jgi:serine protease AprX